MRTHYTFGHVATVALCAATPFVLLTTAVKARP